MMKNTISKLILLSGLALFTRCEDPDNAIYTVLEDYTSGAVLRTKSDPRNTFQFNKSVPSEAFFVKIEQQDEQNGDLLESVDVFVDLNSDLSNTSEAEVRSIPASAFTKNENNLNETEISMTLTDALSALGASNTDFTGGDAIRVRLALNLTDGRTFTNTDATGSLQGSYFSSPYAYNAIIKCIPANPVAGTYNISMNDSYGDGWNGGRIETIINGVSTEHTVSSADGSSATSSFVVPAGATLEVYYRSGDWDSEVTFTITRNSETIFSDGPSPAVDTNMVFSICNI